MYVSPYASGGGYNESAFATEVALLQPTTTTQNRSRSTSLMQDFMAKALSPRQRELVRGHTRTISTDKAVAKSREAERRMSETIQRQARLSGGNMSPIDMSEGLLGPDFGRPGSSSVISDRASPFPDFNQGASLHAHPGSSDQAAPPTVNPNATVTRDTGGSSGVSGLKSLFNMETSGLEDSIRVAQPGRTLNHHMPTVYYSTEDDFRGQIRQVASQYPMGTRPSAYNNYMRDLHKAASGDLYLKPDKVNSARRDSNCGVGEPGNSSFQPLHGYNVMPTKTTVTPSDIRHALEAERSTFARRLSPPPPPMLNGAENDIAVDDSLVDLDPASDLRDKITSPLKEGFHDTLPVMSVDSFVHMD